jgi:GntR family transcriptional regulator/MocR family aminotransferase
VKRRSDEVGPIVTLDRRLRKPLYRQLYDGYRDAILDGRLRSGQRLPSTRTLSHDLQISRIAVVSAFEQLVAEGYVESRVGSGSFVSSGLDEPPRARAESDAPRGGKRRLPRERLISIEGPWLECQGALRVGQVGLDQFPAELWGRLVARHARAQPRRHMVYSDAMGLLQLRESLADYLRTVRSVRCTVEQIMVVSGSQQALAIAAHALVDRGDAAWIEDPGYSGARDALTLAGAELVTVPIDDDGLDVASGIARQPNARLAYVTPSHQYPLGIIMSAPRRLQLLDWARRSGAWILEDDYDSEFRYGTQPIASLQGLDVDQRVVYMGTFSKVLFPALRVGYMVIPRDLVARFRHVRDAMDLFPAPLYQAVLNDFIREGHFARHLRRTRAVYAERRRLLVNAIERELGDRVRIAGDRAGMHIVVLLPPDLHDREIAVRAARRELSIIPLSSCYAGPRPLEGLLLGYGATPSREIPDAVRRLKSVLRT